MLEDKKDDGIFHGRVTPFPAAASIPELFAEQVRARPDSAAVTCGSRTLTYAKLDEWSDRLAHLLRHRGVDADTPVGIVLDRGVDLVAAVLAVLKAGGAYVPADPRYPAERLSSMFADVGAGVVMTRADLLGRLGGAPVEALCLDRVAGELAAAPPTASRLGVSGRNLACVLFTSGSTGRPKGVMIEHRSIVRLVRETDYVAFGPGERVAQVSDPSFDAFTFEVWGALTHGGTLCVLPADLPLTDGGLGRALRAARATTLLLTSALFTEVAADHPDDLAGLRNLLVGGDVLNVARVRELAGSEPAHRPERILNAYGPTETTTIALCEPVESVPADARSIPVGRPIANTSAYVLDERLRPVRVETPGELFVGGPGVARGYAGRPGLTAERFLPDPFAGDGSRMYRTGDVVRYRADGTIEFLGRADDQVKVRGHRIEPGEVEAALTLHPQVGQAVVVTDEAPSGRRLVAHVVPVAGPPAGLREFLMARLPPWMVPSAFVVSPSLPMTSRGKVDRSALPPVPGGGPADGAVPPRTDLERELAALTAEMLGLAEVAVTDDFFALGGHSLLAMRLVSRSNHTYAANVALGDFMDDPTVARLAAGVAETRGTVPPDGRAGAEDDRRLLARLEELSDDEVDALLREPADDEGGR
ncbi:non-ribosomal peptide synthetase [Actinoallomurus sp. CA-142502]|uniref:non-ribosomal peptide synthetase n=1 Tax=Actinoallomurus sp. CA-142502 TaxID=3239885 RepID=UPI003D8CBD70